MVEWYFLCIWNVYFYVDLSIVLSYDFILFGRDFLFIEIRVDRYRVLNILIDGRTMWYTDVLEQSNEQNDKQKILFAVQLFFESIVSVISGFKFIFKSE